MNAVSFYFQVHQPYRVRDYGFFNLGHDHDYFDTSKNIEMLNQVSQNCYLPANQLMLDLIKQNDGAFKISYSISGVLLEQLETWRPDVLESFKQLVDTGCVEILAETYYHSLSFLYSKDEFDRQIKMHEEIVYRLLGAKPKVFRNTQLIYNNEIAEHVQGMGYKGILAEGVNWILNGRTPNYLHHSPNLEKFPVLLRNYKLSDDIALRFSNKDWKEYPLTANKYANWVHSMAGSGDVVNLYLDYETFGEHQSEDTGIFDFLRSIPEEILKHGDFSFMTPSEVISNFEIQGDYDASQLTSWAGTEKDISAWRSNPMQHEALHRIHNIEKAINEMGDEVLLSDWRRLTTSDHFYYMCAKNCISQNNYLNPEKTAMEVYSNYVNVVNDIEFRLESKHSVAFNRLKMAANHN